MSGSRLLAEVAMRLLPFVLPALILACHAEVEPPASPDASVSLPDAGSAEFPADPSAGCTGGSGYGAGATTLAELASGGDSRSFRVHVPPGPAAAPLPLVLMFHGGGGSGRQLEEDSAAMDPIADRDGFVTVYPDGSGIVNTWNAGACCGAAVRDSVDDVAFVSALLDHLEARLCLDRKRVFAAGMSNGAMLVHRLACELSPRFAAVAPVAGTLEVTACVPTEPVAVLEVHGSLDAHVPYDGGLGCGPADTAFTSVPATVEGWRTRNGCEPRTEEYFAQGDGTCAGYVGCEAPVVLCRIEGGGHSWPGGEPKSAVTDCPGDGAQSTTFPASEVIWSFFRSHPKGR